MLQHVIDGVSCCSPSSGLHNHLHFLAAGVLQTHRKLFQRPFGGQHLPQMYFPGNTQGEEENTPRQNGMTPGARATFTPNAIELLNASTHSSHATMMTLVLSATSSCMLNLKISSRTTARHPISCLLGADEMAFLTLFYRKRKFLGMEEHTFPFRSHSSCSLAKVTLSFP